MRELCETIIFRPSNSLRFIFGSWQFVAELVFLFVILAYRAKKQTATVTRTTAMFSIGCSCGENELNEEK